MFSSEDVSKVATLARLHFSPGQVEQLTAEMAAIVGWIEQLEELDTEGIEPLAHVLDLHNVFEDDVVRPGLDRERALANAPKRDDECFLVPPVL